MEQYLEWLKEYAQKLKEEEKALIASDRKDEATFARIRANIVETLKTVAESLMRAKKDDFNRAYIQQFEHFRSVWTASLEKAEAHDDVEKAVIEKIKLETLLKARAAFLKSRRPI